MNIEFYKYQATGNDFIMIDNRDHKVKDDRKLVEKLCDRRFGIGADGMILLQEIKGYDFEMVYYNSDGNKSSMCGNGGRCAASFAQFLGMIKTKTSFWAPDGEHQAVIDPDGIVSLKMQDVNGIETIQTNAYYLNTGSPHYVDFSKEVEQLDVFQEGKKIRYNDRFKKDGTNVNFVEKVDKETIRVRTYERGVEAETFSCGTGVTASALAASFIFPNGNDHEYSVKTLGGELKVRFKKEGKDYFKDIWLIGPAVFVFKGEVEQNQ